MNVTELWEWMMKGNYPDDFKAPREHRTATAILKRKVKTTKPCPHDKGEITVTWPEGMKVKAVMASRFGDIGLTDDLTAEYGYYYRFPAVDGEVHGEEVKADDLLDSITPCELVENV